MPTIIPDNENEEVSVIDKDTMEKEQVVQIQNVRLKLSSITYYEKTEVLCEHTLNVSTACCKNIMFKGLSEEQIDKLIEKLDSYFDIDVLI